MDNIVIISIFILFILYFLYQTFYLHLLSVTANDGRLYAVKGNDYSSAITSANILAELNRRANLLIQSIRQDCESSNCSILYQLHILSNQYSYNCIHENPTGGSDPTNTSYTVNKRDIYICLKHKGDYYDINTLVYVLLHELAHMCNYDNNGNAIEGHGPEFQIIFKSLVQKAMSLNIYQYTNYSVTPKDYCGMTITSNIV